MKATFTVVAFGGNDGGIGAAVVNRKSSYIAGTI